MSENLSENFDEIGRSIMREIIPYLMNYPFSIVSVKVNSHNMLEIIMRCKQCDKEIPFRILGANIELTNPFRTGMTIVYIYYNQHYQHPKEEEP